jgi:iron complex transport system permease protein
VAILLIVFAMRTGIPGSISMIGAAFFGALLSMGFVLLISARMRGKPTLIVAGIMIGYICSAATDFLVTFADDAQIVSLHNWSKGSFSGMDWGDVRVMSLLTVLCFAGILLLAKPISAYRLGEEYARSLGVDVLRLQVLLVLYSSLLAACVTAYAGPVSFVGIAVPQLIRALLRTERPQLLIPACFLGGGIFCLVSDLIARSIFSPAELSISSVTAVFGAPVVIIILLRRKGAV